jgi:hypothetical protein
MSGTVRITGKIDVAILHATVPAAANERNHAGQTGKLPTTLS